MAKWRGFPTSRHSNSTLYKTLYQPSSMCAGGPRFFLGTYNLQPFEIIHLFNSAVSSHTTCYGIPFGMLVNDRHIVPTRE